MSNKLYNLLFILSVLFFVSLKSIFAIAHEENNSFHLFSNDKSTEEYFKFLDDMIKKIQEQYVYEISNKDTIEKALKGFLSSLDPHSAYLNEKEYSEIKSTVASEFGGLGIEVTKENDFIKIISPYEGGPAFRAGIKPGDYILMVDDKFVKGLNQTEIVKKLRGSPGTTVRIKIYRESTGERLEFQIIREIIKTMPVKMNIVDDSVLYIKVPSFADHTADSIESIYKDLSKKHSITGVVLDLRGNPGGLLDQAVAVSDLFLSKGNIVTIKGRDPKSNQTYTANEVDIFENLPVVIIINSGTASASEIIAGALQDNKRALVIGMKSFGKGSIQSVMPIPAGILEGSAIKLTTALYYTPSGRSIQADGILPDVIVPAALVKNVEHGEDIGSEASLEGSIERADNENFLVSNKRGLKSSTYSQGEDFQLLRAIDILKTMSLYNNKVPDLNNHSQTLN